MKLYIQITENTDSKDEHATHDDMQQHYIMYIGPW